MIVRLHIGEVVLDGVPAMNKRRLLDALRDARGARPAVAVVVPGGDAALEVVTAGPLTPVDDSRSALASSLAGVSQAVLP
jgi:hypothetical protein